MKCKQYNIIATFIFMLSFLCLFLQKVSAQQTKSNNTQASVQSQASIRLNKAGSVVERGQKVKLKARISNSRSKKVVWKSSKRRVATVNRNGQVIARGKGTASNHSEDCRNECICTERCNGKELHNDACKNNRLL